MKRKTELIIPHPPTVNHYYRPGAKTGRRVLTDRGLLFRADVREAIRIQLGPDRDEAIRTGRIAIRVVLCPPDRRRRDLDNPIKPLLDALEKSGLIEDDARIDRLDVARGPVWTGGGYCLVEIEAIPEAPVVPAIAPEECPWWNRIPSSQVAHRKAVFEEAKRRLGKK